MAADSVENSKVARLSSFGKKTLDALRDSLPAGASLYNPIDLMGDAGVDRYKKALEEVLKDKDVNGALVILTPQAMSKIKETAELLTHIDAQGKPIFSCFLGGRLINEGIGVLRQGRVPNYTFPERAVNSFSTMVKFMQWKKTPKETIPIFDVDKKKAAKVMDLAKAEGYYYLPEYIAQEIISSYGFCLPKSYLAKSAAEASFYAEEIGYPVVMKIASPDILHKSDIGGVSVNLDNKAKVEQAYYAMTQKAKRVMPQAHVEGVLIQQMITEGKEVIMGMSKDPQFGPLIMFGLGGIYVEVLKDVSFRIAPVSSDDANSMIK
jgi:acetyltransferase